MLQDHLARFPGQIRTFLAVVFVDDGRIFADGSYLEFFNWYDKPPSLDDENLPMRFWGPKTPGLIDFAITDTTHSAEESVDAVNQRLTEGPEKDAGLGIKFGNPIAGSHKKADGMEIKWKVTRPEFSKGEKTPGQVNFANGRIDVPFFCHDVTPRTGRGLQTEYVRVYSKILGSEVETTGEGNSHTLDLGVPQGPTRSTVVVWAAESEQDIKRMQERGIGFSDLVIAVKPDGPGGKNRRQLGPTGIESTIWIETSEESE
ncbi:hypothetical protein IL306_010517 [Fusarium sp. DS 682]|nr:hypothetical protein IL306_010517 [Fusarium sp. DS 682]